MSGECLRVGSTLSLSYGNSREQADHLLDDEGPGIEMRGKAKEIDENTAREQIMSVETKTPHMFMVNRKPLCNQVER